MNVVMPKASLTLRIYIPPQSERRSKVRKYDNKQAVRFEATSRGDVLIIPLLNVS